MSDYRECEFCERKYPKDCKLTPNSKRFCSWGCAHESENFRSPFEVLYLNDGSITRFRSSGKGKPKEV